jgi:hypothetical protein
MSSIEDGNEGEQVEATLDACTLGDGTFGDGTLDDGDVVESDAGAGDAGVGRSSGPSDVGGSGGSGGFGDPVFVVPVALRSLLGGFAEVAADDVRGVDDDVLLGLFDGLETLDRLFHSARFAVLAELDARDLTVRRLGHVVANQAGWRHGADPRRVRRDLNTATTLRRHLPDVAAALSRGEIAADRARELAFAVNDRNSVTLGSIQPALINLAQAPSTFRQFGLDVEQLSRLTDLDGPEPAPAPRDHGTLSQSGDCVHLDVDMYGTDAVAFAQRLTAEIDRLYRQAVAEHDLDSTLPVPPRSELLVTALKNLCESGAAHRHSGRQTPAGSFAIVIDATADEAHGLFRDGVLLPGPTNTGPTVAGPTVAGPVDWSKRARLVDGTRLRYSSREWDLLTCDAEYSMTIVGAGGHPVACQSGSRLASREQRRNVEFRDGQCVFPGCDAPVNWCDAHHVVHHQHGGPTETPNLVLLCRRHHGIIHSTGWSMTANPNPDPNPDPGDDPGGPGGSGGGGVGLFRITSPTGAVMHTQHHRGPGWRSAVPA